MPSEENRDAGAGRYERAVCPFFIHSRILAVTRPPARQPQSPRAWLRYMSSCLRLWSLGGKRADMQGAVVVVVLLLLPSPPRAPHATFFSRCAMGLVAVLTWAAPLAMPLTAHDRPHSSRIGTAQQACEMHPLTHQWASSPKPSHYPQAACRREA